MRFNTHFKIPKYLAIEIIFFLVYFYLVGLLSSFEYNFWEKHFFGISAKELEFSLVYGTFNVIAFTLFYLGLHYCLRENKLLSFVLLILGFLIAFFFFKKASYLLISHLHFLSEGIRKDAIKWYHLERLGFTFNYIILQFCGVSFLAYFIHSSKQKEQLKTLKEQQLLSELTYLKAQLHPHFFFNTLNNIYSLALQKSADTAPLVHRLSEMMRYILYKSACQMVSLAEEIAFIRNYVEVERIRYRSAITINFEEQGIDQQSEISPLLLLPFIENAFKHGVQEEERGGFVTILICKAENELTMEVSNSIADKKPETGGIGLYNVKKRLEMLYPNRYNLTEENSGAIYQVYLTIEMK
ncbi:sensor histidine kinase [Pedobacter aquatilis]|uniref:sensor histidine kinase n=1 Tax=Pedobacter aquatilis TaxID=351343 RepID=UPI002930E155|nr:histidine kinase [Pedobacter aquatilis]